MPSHTRDRCRTGLLRRTSAALLALALTLTAGAVAAADRDIVLGSLMDLSGRLAGPSMQTRNGLQMRFDEENGYGGIRGRRIRLVVEDTAGGAEAAANKLLRGAAPLAVIGSVGPDAVAVAAPLLAERHVADLFAATPVTATGPATLRFRFQADYARQIPLGIRYLLGANGYRRPAVVYQDDAYGRDVRAGFEAAIQTLKAKTCDSVAYAPGGIAAALAQLRSKNCDFVVLGSFPDDILAGLKTAREGGWTVAMLGASMAYGDAALAAGAEGLYALAPTPAPREAEASPGLSRWMERYRTRFKQTPSAYSVVGYVSADIFITAAQLAGARLDAAGIAAALEASRLEADYFGHPAFALGDDEHAGNRAARLGQVRGGRWQIVTEPLK